MIAYTSRTGNIRYIISRLALPAADIDDISVITEPFLLFTYTDQLGEVPIKVKQFMDRNGELCQGVVVSGNSNFGPANYGGAGDKLSRQWQVPLVRKLEMRGFTEDYEAIHRFYEQCFQEERVG